MNASFVEYNELDDGLPMHAARWVHTYLFSQSQRSSIDSRRLRIAVQRRPIEVKDRSMEQQFNAQMTFQFLMRRKLGAIAFPTIHSCLGRSKKSTMDRRYPCHSPTYFFGFDCLESLQPEKSTKSLRLENAKPILITRIVLDICFIRWWIDWHCYLVAEYWKERKVAQGW